jgi:hypothetical protein
MSSNFSFPGLNLDDNDPNSRFLDLYNRFSSQYPDIGNFLKPDDPDLQEYQRLSGEPTGSEDLIKNYVESMPTREQYNPSFRDKLIATALGALAGNPTAASAVVKKRLDEPYSEAVDEWKMEGSNVGTRARLIDAERQRKLQAIKYGLQTKAGTAKSEASQETRKLQEARRIADQVASEEKATKDASDRESERTFRRDMTNRTFALQKDMDEWRKREAVLDNTRADKALHDREAAKAERATDLEQINKDLFAHASQQGVDHTNMTALDVAKILAFKKAKANPAFGDLLEEINGNYAIKKPDKFMDPSGGQARRDILIKYMDRLTQKYLRGEFQ